MEIFVNRFYCWKVAIDGFDFFKTNQVLTDFFFLFCPRAFHNFTGDMIYRAFSGNPFSRAFHILRVPIAYLELTVFVLIDISP